MRLFTMYILFLLVFPFYTFAQLPAFPGAEGFGALSTGGRGGDVYHVTALEDSGFGSLREGVELADGPRIIVFDISGTIILEDILWIKNSNLTIAGQTAPGDGICIRDYSVNIKKANDIIIRYLRFRLGDVQTLAKGKPTGSIGLDVISIDDSKNIIIDHCSLSWSCDEIFGIVQNENVTIQWCLIAEPLGDPLLHPYGSSHAYGLNNSANTLSVHHCIISNYVMRGPEFEPNDAVNDQGYQVQMEAVNNIMFDYKKSGSRYKTGIEDHPEEASEISFQFHFLNNYFIRKPGKNAPEIHAVTKLGVTDQLKVFVDGNIGPNRISNDLNPWKSVWVENGPNILEADSNIRAQMATEPLFTSTIPITLQPAEEAYESVLQEVGCSNQRDLVDKRVLNDVKNKNFYDYLHSQETVGGWPILNSSIAPLDTDQDGMPDWWEDEQELDKADPEDRNSISATGYTNLETYLNNIDLLTNIKKEEILKSSLIELNNYPNPFNPTTTIRYLVPNVVTSRDFSLQRNISLQVYDVLGKLVNTLVDELKPAGNYNVEFDGSNLSSGVYYYQLRAGEFIESRKMLLLK